MIEMIEELIKFLKHRDKVKDEGAALNSIVG